MKCSNCGHSVTLRKGLVGKSQPDECGECGEELGGKKSDTTFTK